MVQRETIDGLYFVAQTTYYIYESEDDCLKGLNTPILITSSTVVFEEHKRKAKHNLFLKSLPVLKEDEILEYHSTHGYWCEYTKELLMDESFEPTLTRVVKKPL